LADVITTHAASLAAVHAQSRATPIESVPVPPAAGVMSAEFVRLTVQREGVGAVVECSADVQAEAAARSENTSSRVVGRLTRNLGAYRLQLRYRCGLAAAQRIRCVGCAREEAGEPQTCSTSSDLENLSGVRQ
jgi:hypothetical protein